MVSFFQPNSLRKPPALKRLQQVQEEIFRQLHLLIPDEFALHDLLVSGVSGSRDLPLFLVDEGALMMAASTGVPSRA